MNGQIVMLSDPPALSWIAEETIIATVPLTSAPNQLLIHPATGWIYLALPDEWSVLVLGGTTPLATVPLAGPPVQMAVRPQGGPVYVADEAGVLSVISGTETLAALPLGTYGLAGVAVHPSSGWAYTTDPWADRVHVLSGTAVLTDVVVGSYPQAIAAQSGSGYVYVAAGEGNLYLISGTQVVTSVGIVGPCEVLAMHPAPAGGLLYAHKRGIEFDLCDRLAVYRGAEEAATWTLPEGTRYSAFAFHPSLSPIYAGHGVYGSLLSIGAGTHLVETIPVGGGSWVRAVAVLPTGRVYAATDHEIAILEMEVGYRFYLPVLIKGVDMEAAGHLGW
jgi:DNA-binding beta-propeller fold protein YncE